MSAAAHPPPGGGGEWVHLFRADPQLAAQLPAATLHAAMPYAFARVRWLEAGRWSPELEPPVAGDLGLLVLDGFLARQVRVLDRPCTELLGPGDLLRPWEPAHTDPFVARSVAAAVRDEDDVTASEVEEGNPRGEGVLGVVLELRPGLAPEQVRAVATRVGERLATDGELRARIDGLAFRIR